MAYRDIAGRHRWSWLEESVSITTTAAAPTTAITTADFMYFGRLRPNSANTLLTPDFVPWNAMRDDFMRTSPTRLPIGPPTKYSVWENTIYWYPIPDAVYTYSMQYWKQPPDLFSDGDVPLIREKDRDVLVFGALAYAALRDNDMPRMATFQNQYEGMIAKMWRLDNLEQSETTRKIAMPKSYGGIYGD